MRNGGTLAVGIGETGDINLLPLAYGGHCFYVRKCKTPEELDGVVIPEVLQDTSQWVEVVGKGPRVGQPCPKDHMHRFKRAKCVEDDADVGDLLLCPNDHLGIKRSEICAWEFFIEESIPYVIKKG